MLIDIIGSESLGVRGLCCSVETAGRRLLIDPGIALGYRRARRLPHPLQVAVGERTREKIVSRWTEATDIVISHFHGDHVPLRDANPFQLALSAVAERNPQAVIWAKTKALSSKEVRRYSDLQRICPAEFRSADSTYEGILEFSPPVPHGAVDRGCDSVLLTKIQGDKIFVHASDIQLLNGDAVDRILSWGPNIIFASGPPLYLGRISDEDRRFAWKNALALAGTSATLILDHHLLRSREGERWLDRLSEESGKKVLCGADFMGRPRLLLEADRQRLYREMPVPDGWHTDYARGCAHTDSYWEKGIELGWVSDPPDANSLFLS